MSYEKYNLAWQYLQDKKYKEGFVLFNELAQKNYFKAMYDLAGIYYYGLYGFKKDINKAISYYRKAFLLRGDLNILRELIYAKIEESGKFKTLLYIIFDRRLLKKLIHFS